MSNAFKLNLGKQKALTKRALVNHNDRCKYRESSYKNNPALFNKTSCNHKPPGSQTIGGYYLLAYCAGKNPTSPSKFAIK